MKTLGKAIIALAFGLLLQPWGCSEKSSNPSESNSFPTALFPFDQVINYFVNESIGSVDAIQIVQIAEKHVCYDQQLHFGDYYTLASTAAYYKVGDRAGAINFVGCNGKPLVINETSPVNYGTSWNKNEGPQPGENAIWETRIGNETIVDTIPIPPAFLNLRSSPNYFDRQQGTTISWDNTTSGDVVIIIQTHYEGWDTVRNEMYRYTKLFPAFLKIVPDQGSVTITPQDIETTGLWGENIVGIDFYLYRANYKIRHFDNGNKQLLNVALNQRNIDLVIPQE